MSNVIPLRDPDRGRKVAELIAKQRYCPYTGKMLTPDCVVLVGKDREPRWLLSQEGWDLMTDAMKRYLANRGTVPDKSTIRKEVR